MSVRVPLLTHRTSKRTVYFTMSVSSIIAKNNFLSPKERLGMEFKLRGHEMIVGAIKIAVSLAIAVALTGDINDVVARRRRS